MRVGISSPDEYGDVAFCIRGCVADQPTTAPVTTDSHHQPGSLFLPLHRKGKITMAPLGSLRRRKRRFQEERGRSKEGQCWIELGGDWKIGRGEDWQVGRGRTSRPHTHTGTGRLKHGKERIGIWEEEDWKNAVPRVNRGGDGRLEGWGEEQKATLGRLGRRGRNRRLLPYPWKAERWTGRTRRGTEWLEGWTARTAVPRLSKEEPGGGDDRLEGWLGRIRRLALDREDQKEVLALGRLNGKS